MICVNELFGMKCNKKEILNQFIIVLAPFAPHVCEELWETPVSYTHLNFAPILTGY